MLALLVSIQSLDYYFLQLLTFAVSFVCQLYVIVRFIFRSGTDLILLLFSFLLLLGRPALKKPKAVSFQIRSERNLARMFSASID